MAKRIVIASGKGGVGKTTVCVALGKALAAAGKKVLLLDFDNLRSIDLMLGAAGDVVFDWGDAAKGRCGVADAVLEADGLAFMTCPPDYDVLTNDDVKRLVREVEPGYDFLLFDAPAGIGRGLSLACAAAQKALVVATPDLVCVRAACRAAEQMESLGVRNSRLVINRAVYRDIRRKKLLNIDDVIDETGVQLIAIIPEDKNLRRAGMSGKLFAPRNLSYEPFRRLSKRIQGKQAPLWFV